MGRCRGKRGCRQGVILPIEQVNQVNLKQGFIPSQEPGIQNPPLVPVGQDHPAQVQLRFLQCHVENLVHPVPAMSSVPEGLASCGQ